VETETREIGEIGREETNTSRSEEGQDENGKLDGENPISGTEDGETPPVEGSEDDREGEDPSVDTIEGDIPDWGTEDEGKPLTFEVVFPKEVWSCLMEDSRA
jgi:hypothetical protein